MVTLRRSDGLTFLVPDQPGVQEGAPVRIAVRPEWLDLFHPGAVPPGENALPARVVETIYLGETMHVLALLEDGSSIRVALRNEGQLTKPLPWRSGDAVMVGWLPEDCQVLEEA